MLSHALQRSAVHFWASVENWEWYRIGIPEALNDKDLGTKFVGPTLSEECIIKNGILDLFRRFGECTWMTANVLREATFGLEGPDDLKPCNKVEADSASFFSFHSSKSEVSSLLDLQMLNCREQARRRIAEGVVLLMVEAGQVKVGESTYRSYCSLPKGFI